MEEVRKKVGLMGGTFDPIHVGHLVLAEAAREELSLSQVWFMPAGQPPHKDLQRGRGSKEQRTQMVQLAIEGNPFFSLCLLEMEEERKSYTYLTLEHLRKRYPEVDFVFLIGEDSFWDFPGWRRPDLIAAQCEIAVYRRGNGDRPIESAVKEYEERYGSTFTLLTGSPLEISSSYLRERAREGKSLRYYVPEAVYAFIKQEGLYVSG
ncbi:MAG: nicotinate (nicotinamide) nucleotide adenylyltransferase [Blautia sp.]|nr:nicotinate (nicotinamide) nucleotide adenylyltransferase [Blautia sp.]